QNAANGAYYTADYAAKNTRPDDIHTARRTRAADLSVLSRIAAETLGIRLSPPRAEYQKDGSVSIEYRAANRFDVVFGEAHRPKDGISGDVKAALKLGGDKFIAVLSDGMGHGARANSSGENAIALVESFYRAGFTDEIVIPFVNRALCAVSGGVFATLDMCVVDLIDGSVSFVKMGSDDSYIRRKNRVETIENTALPLGASDDASPSVLNKRLDADDFVVLVSDGIANAFNEGGLKDLISQINTKNPQAFADELLKCALYNGVRDDLSVIALRLYRKIGNM
ncbi:MAG: SpoIIE family protein phosphatase, partial [Clostridiales bacterium]|nr:SpoIIE family protein phosphatase [Clostridiales bacterium]